MDPGGSELDSSLPQSDNPCLIVEDSQPDSVAQEDDPESSYRALLARRLSSLQPTSRSPVLELISSPLGSRYSQSDSQSESSQSNNQAEPGVVMAANPSSAFEEESQVVSFCPPNKKKCPPEDGDMDSGADSTTHCVQSEGEPSQFGFLELSQSQDQRGEVVNSRQEEADVGPRPDSEGRGRSAEQSVGSGTSESRDNGAVRSEVSSSCSLAPSGRSGPSGSGLSGSGSSGRPLGVQALLHSEGLQEPDCEILSSQEDMFDKTGSAVDSTVSEPEQHGRPTPTPAHTLRLLHLSGQGTLVQESLSQDYVSPTPDAFHTPLIIPSSPTEDDHGADEPMDTSLPPEDRAGGKEEEPMETEAASKPRPSASTPVSQNSPGFVSERALSLPSQPEFSHDVFVPTQSQEAARRSDKKTGDAPPQRRESASFPLPLQLSCSGPARPTSEEEEEEEEEEEDSQATQIEELGEPLGAADAAASRQRSESNGVPPESQTPTSSKAAAAASSAESPKPRGDCAENDSSEAAGKSEAPKESSLNIEKVNVKAGKEASAAASKEASAGGKEASAAASKEACDAASKEASAAAIKEASAAASKEASAAASKEGSAAAIKEASAAASKEASDAASKEASDAASKEASDAASKEASAAASKEASAAASKEASAAASKEASAAGEDAVSCSQPKFDSSDATAYSCVQETPPADTTPEISPTSAVDAAKGSADSRKQEAGSAESVESPPRRRVAAGSSQAAREVMEERKQGEEEEVMEERKQGEEEEVMEERKQGEEEEVMEERKQGEEEEEVMEERKQDEEEEEEVMEDRKQGEEEEVTEERKQGEEEEVMEVGSGMALVLSHSELLSPEPMEEEEEEEEESEGRGDDSVIVVSDGERDSPPIGGNAPVSTNGHEPPAQEKKAHAAPDRLSQPERAGPGPERAGPEPEGLKDRSLSDSSGEISFHFTLPKEGELIGPVVGATPPLISQLKQTLRHSTPIEISSFSEKSDVAADAMAAMATSDIVSGESGDDAAAADAGDGKLSLRMKLVTPVEEGSSERFSLQKPALSEEGGSVAKVTAVAKAVTSSPSVFSRVRQVHRQQEARDDNTTPVRGPLPASSQRSSPASSLGCNSFPNSQPEPSQQEVAAAAPQETRKAPPGPAEDRRAPPPAPEPPAPNRTGAGPRDGAAASSPPNKLRQRTVSQQTSFDAPGMRSPAGRGEPESPSYRRAAGPAHRRHVRTIQEVRTTVTRIITDVYYEDGKEVERKVTEESEEPVVDCQVLDGDISPCRTGNSSVTSGDLADVSSLSSKASSLQHSSGGTSSSGFTRPDFIMPPVRGAFSPRRGGGQQQRGHRGRRAGSVVTVNRGHGAPGSRALDPLTPRGRARRGRPRSRSSMSRGGGSGSLQRLGAHGPPHSSSEDERFTRMLPPRLPASPAADFGGGEPPGRSDSLRSSSPPEEEDAGHAHNSAGSSFVGLRVVAKWTSNGYFYSGRIVGDAGEGRFRLRFDDGYECEVAGRDILLCDPIPMETEVTALLEDEYFSIGVVRAHKTEGQDLFYSVEKDGQRQWYNRTAIILSLEQGNRLREQHGLGPYEPCTPLAKAADISLDNLVEGKRRRRGAPEGPTTPDRSPRAPGPSGKRKLMASEDTRTPAKRGRRGSGARAAQRAGLCNTSGSGTDLPGRPGAAAETHGPLPQNTTLFMGFAFMLTASSEIDRLTNRNGSDDEDDYVQTGPYNKVYTESQLQAGGGFVLQDFNEEQCKAAYQSLLIADQHCRTRKYLLCLASGVPSVSHIWVRDCCKENKLLNYRNYLLPAGVGPDEAIVEWHPRCSPFKALRVLLVFEKPVELWAQLITMGGGSSVRQFPADKDASDVPAGRYDVVVTDRACPASVEKTVTSQEVPLVSPEWLIQSVIRGERLGFQGKPQYRHDYSSSSSSSSS